MVIINFASEKLGSSIKSDKVSVDGYEAENLLCGDVGWQRKGFLAERFIKPPVTLTLRLPCPVNLYRIVIDPHVGGQRSSAVEIYTAVARRTVKMTKPSDDSRSSAVNFNTKNKNSVFTNSTRTNSNTDSSKAEIVSDPEPIFVRVANVRCLDSGQVCFTNPRFRADHPAAGNNLPGVDSFPHHAEIHNHQWWAVSAVEFVAIRITSAIGGGVVAIGRLEVWGQPARSCPSQVKEEITDRYIAMIKPRAETKHPHSHTAVCSGVNEDGSITDQSSEFQNSTDNCLPASDTIDQLQIPEEFLDSLTCEIMATPMLLPSGHTVDLSTVDRFSDAEATHGRQPSDPFTGLAFTATRRPVLNKSLKVRIDRFLSENAQNSALEQVPRMLGRGSSLGASSLDVTTHSTITNMRLPTGLKTVSNIHMLKRKHEVLSLSVQSDSEDPPTKLTKIHSSTVSGQYHNNQRDFVTRNAMHSVKTETSTVFGGQHYSICHEDRLKDSLSNSLSAVLQGLPSFTTTPQVRTEERKQCSACSKDLERLEKTLYKLPCAHIICRACLTAIKRTSNLTCPNCHAECQRADIVRIHV